MINRFIHQKIITAALITGCFFMCACENDVNEVRELGRKRTNMEEGKNIESYLSMNGKMKAHLTAPVLLRSLTDSGKKAEFPNTLHVDFFNDSMKVESQISALYGRYMENEQKVFLRDHVVAFNTKGDTLYCEELYWDQTLQKIYTGKKVTWSKSYRSSLIVGLGGMTASQDMSDIKIFNIQPISYFTYDSTKSAATPVAPPADSAKKKN